MRPSHAVLMAAVLNAAGAFAGLEVAATIGKGIIDADLVDIQTVGAAMMGIVVWSTIAWYYGLPTSESHGLVAGLSGAGLATAGPGRAPVGGLEEGAHRHLLLELPRLLHRACSS